MWFVVLLAVCIAENRFLEFNDLNLLTSSNYESIFGNINYLDKLNKNAEYNIDVADKFGKYIKLSYKSKHSDNTEILKLDEIAHKSKIISLLCLNDAIKLEFKSEKIATKHHRMIEFAMDLEKKYFVTGGNHWNCTHFKTNRIESILRQIIDIDINEKELTLYTANAKLIDIFKDLNISFKTNMNYHETNPVHNHQRTKQTQPTRRRLAGGFFSDLWEGFTNGVNEAVDYVKNVVQVLIVDVIPILLGDPVSFSGIASKTWSWNYNNNTYQALEPFYFQDGVLCADCYVFMDLVYEYQLIIADHSINYLYLCVGGNIEINLDVASDTAYHNEWTKMTKKYPIPDLSFDVAGIQFGLHVYGSISIGATIDIDTFSFAVNVAGWLEKGIEYNATTGEQYYINNQSLNYRKEGPRAQFESAKVTIYLRPTLSFTLEPDIGSFYFGLQPEFILDITKNDDSNCPIYFVPSVKLTYFIGATLAIVNWNKEIALNPQQSTLNNLAGCINKYEITRSQTAQSDVTYSDYVYTGPHANIFCGDTINNSTSAAYDGNYYVFTDIWDQLSVISVTFSLCGSTYDTTLWILDESYDTVAYNDDSCSQQSAITLSKTNFTTYVNYIVVGGYNNSFGNYTLQVTCTSTRRLQSSLAGIAAHTASAYIDYSDINLYDNSINIFGNSSSEWWGNLSSVNDICNDWSLSCNGYTVPIILPQIASLLISVQDDNSLIGIYHTLIEITPWNGWNLTNSSIYSEVSCIARHSFELVYDNADDALKRYHVALLDWYCDTNLTNIGIDEILNPDDYSAWECMISLPYDMSAISLDKSFGSILLFESSDWCHVFILSTKPGYTLNKTKINNIDWKTFQYPSALWYGLWNCGVGMYNGTSTQSELYFAYFNHTTQWIVAYLYLGDYTYVLSGYTDLDNMNMTLWFDYYIDPYNYSWIPYTYNNSFRFIGNLNVLYDGTMIYGGTIEHSDCTGFLFQGYVNMTQFDYMDSDISPTNTPTNIDTSTNTPTNTPTNVDTSTNTPTNTPTTVDTDHSSTTVTPGNSPTNTPTHSDISSTSNPTDDCSKNNANTNVFFGIIWFVIGMVTSFMILGIIFVFYRCRSKQVFTEKHLELVNAQL